MSSTLADALADVFDHTATIYAIAGNATGRESNYGDQVLHADVPAVYGPMLVNRLQVTPTFDPEATGVDQMLLNAAFPELKTGMQLTLKKGSLEKRFYIQDAAVTPLGFTLVTMTPRRKK